MEFHGVHKVFLGRKDLTKYGSNALLLWAIQMHYEIEDIDTFASSYLTDGTDDQKCDLIWVSRDDGIAIVAQSYYKKSGFDRGEAPANKASDLNTAVASLLGDKRLEDLPERIRSATQDLREAIGEGEINSIYIYYIHNLNESANVEKQLATVQLSAKKFLDLKEINVVAEEIGQTTLVDWYENVEIPIRVTDEFEIFCPKGYEIEQKRWKAISTVIEAREIYRYYKKYGAKLFSGNPRSFLGLIKSDQNINFGIRKTAQEEPDDFWVYHNGISVIVNRFDYSETEGKLRFSGLSIVNGAQTTGAVGNLNKEPSENVRIPVRFIQAKEQRILKEISRYNNSQNKMLPSDFRSGDSVQKKLVEEFKGYPGKLSYSGGRRGGETDAISRDPNIIPSDTVAQSLTAFHGRPDIAYKYKGRIWTENEAYNRIFNDSTSCQHILFVYSLHKKILAVKENLKRRGTELTDAQKSILDFLNQRGSIFLVIYGVSRSMETFLGHVVPDKFGLMFRAKSDLATLEENWHQIVDSVLAFSNTLNDGLKKYSFTVEDVNSAVTQFSELILSTSAGNKQIYESFAALVDK